MGVGITSAFLHLGELVRWSLPIGRIWLRGAATISLLAVMGLADAADPVPALSADARAKLTTALQFAIDDAGTATNGIGRALRSVARSTGNDQTVVVLLDVPVTDANLAAIRATGATIRSSAARWNTVTVEATAAQVAALAALPAVSLLKLPGKPIHRGQPGTVNNPAGTVIKSDILTFTTNVTGAGQKIGIISDSINLTSATGTGVSAGSTSPFTLTGTRPQQSGDLPASIQVIDYGTGGGGEDEGEAMMEEAYKLAPGASYAFSTCGDTELEFAANITKLAQAHCTVICDDIGFPEEPFFQDGPVAQAAEAFIAGGGIYLAAFGNDFDQGVLQTYTDVSATADPHTAGTTPTNGNDFHNWGITGSATPGFLPLQVPADGELKIVLEWNQPFHSNAMGAGAASDYNLFLYNGPSIASGIVKDSLNRPYISVDTQNAPATPGNPVEGFIYVAPHNGGASTTVYLAIDKLHSTVNSVLRVVIIGDFAVPPDAATYASVFGAAAGFGHPTAKDVLGIAAADVRVSPPLPESFTSKGGVGTAGIPYFFDASGAALSPSPTTYDKPELTAPDAIQTFTGFDNGRFFGTSAAVPNAAAAAALAWSGNRVLTNAQIRARLVATADDITRAPASTGNDAFTGQGMVNAQRAAGAPVTTIDAPGANGSHGTGTIAIQLTFAAPVAVTGTPRLLLNTVPPRFATFTSVTGSVVTFTYTIVAGDVSSHLDLASNTALDLNGGTILVATATTAFHAGDPIMLQLPTPGATGSLSANSTVVISATGPTVTIVPDQARKNTSGFAFTVTFSDAVTGLAAGQFAITDGTAGALTGSGTTYTLTVTATAPGTITVTLPAGVVLDGNGVGNHAGTGTATFDQTPPTLVITPALNSVVTTNAVPVTFTFSEAVVGFTAGDIGVANGTVGTLTGSGAVYHMTMTAGTPGPMTITVLGGTVSDLAANVSSADATATVTVTLVPSGSGHGCGLGSMFASVFGLGLLAFMARLRGRDGAARS
jgi:hypothetical protein